MADPRPTVHVTNWSSRKLHGPGRKLTIMALPRAWEHGDGRVVALIPFIDDLRAAQSGAITLVEYRRRFLTMQPPLPLEPGRLFWRNPDGGGERVADGDTLCCACSREAAAKGECHRVWAAELLLAAGWNVVLDGIDVRMERLANELDDNNESIVGCGRG